MYVWCMHTRACGWEACAMACVEDSFQESALSCYHWVPETGLTFPGLEATPLHMPSLRHSAAISPGVLNLGDLRLRFGILREY